MNPKEKNSNKKLVKEAVEQKAKKIKKTQKCELKTKTGRTEKQTMQKLVY
jgi:hypothetical protein